MASRRGQAWTENEMSTVLQMVSDKKTVDEIAVAQERTANSIRFKLLTLACNEHLKNGKSLEDVQLLTGLSADEISKAVTQRTRPAKPATPATPLKKLNVLTPEEDIRDILNEFNRLQGRLARYVGRT